MKTRLIFAIFLLALTCQPCQSQSVFGALKKWGSDIDNAFTGDRDAAEAKKRREDQQAAEQKLREEQARIKAEKDAAIAERIAVHDKDANGEHQLMRAIRAGDLDVSKDLIKRGANPTLVNNRGVSTLHEAVKSENAGLVQLILVNGGNVNAQDGFQKTPLDIAMQFPNNEVVEKLVMNNAPITISHIDRAIQLDKTQVLTTLLQNGGNPEYVLVVALERNKSQLFQDVVENYNVKLDNSVFDYAIEKRNFEIAEYLLSTSIDPHKALDYAISKDAKAIMEPLMNAGADANKVLSYAIEKRDQQLAENSIMMHNADPNPHLRTAIEKNNLQMTEMLLMNNADASLGLSTAVQKNSLPMVKLLLDNNADPNKEIAAAAAKGSDQMVQAMLDKGADPNKGGMAAAKAGKYNTAKKLIEAGAEANPILPIAVKGKNLPLVNACLAAGANANTGMATAMKMPNSKMALVFLEANADATPPSYINTACMINSTELVAKLLEKGADPNNGMEKAVGGGNIQINKMLLAAGADASPAAYISTAIKLENRELVTMLLEAGADANNGIAVAVDKNMNQVVKQLLAAGADASPAKYMARAVKSDNSEMVGLLLGAGADANNGIKASIMNNQTAIAKQLLAAGADASPAAYISKAVEVQNGELVGMLLEAGADPNNGMEICITNNDETILTQLLTKGADGTNPSFIKKACTTGNVSIVQQLISAGADATAPSLLEPAIKHRNEKLTALLFENGADQNAAVEPAVKYNAHTVVKQLANNGVDLTSPTILYTAISQGLSTITGILLEAGSDPNAYTVPGTGYKMLHIAANNINLSIANMLIQHNADVNALTSTSGDTPLHLLAMRKKPGQNGASLAEALITAGADVNARNAKDELVFQVCKSGKVKAVLKKNDALRK